MIEDDSKKIVYSAVRCLYQAQLLLNKVHRCIICGCKVSLYILEFRKGKRAGTEPRKRVTAYKRTKIYSSFSTSRLISPRNLSTPYIQSSYQMRISLVTYGFHSHRVRYCCTGQRVVADADSATKSSRIMSSKVD